jgi:signal transduction histidine kinase
MPDEPTTLRAAAELAREAPAQPAMASCLPRAGSGRSLGALDDSSDLAQTLRQLEVALEKSRVELEQRVQERTTDLLESNARLRREVAELRQGEAEGLRLEQQRLQVQKLESLGVLAGGIAHDFNNLLVAILGNADLALDEIPATSAARDSLQQIKKASLRAADLCRQMLAYSGKGRFVIERIHLDQLVSELVPALKSSIAQNATLNLKLDPSLPPMHGDASQIRQMLLNLVINASEAFGSSSGEIVISTGIMHCSREFLASSYLDEQQAEGWYVWLQVLDTGCGMDPAMLRRIFEPFYTTKFTGRGLGLSAVLGIVRGHKGALEVRSCPGQGTSFRVFFPVKKEDMPIRSADSEADESWRGSGTVLVVDDESGVRATAGRMLERLGFRVVSACDGREALQVYRQQGEQIGVILLDLTMPYLNGEETLLELRRLNPDVRVILSSGFSESDIASRFAGKGLAGFAQKPYTRQELQRQLRSVLS